MKFIPSKKGQWEEEILKHLIEFVLIFAVVLLPLWYFANSSVLVEGYEKIFLAKDLGLLTDSLYIGQGNITFSYAENTSAHIIDFSTNRINVYDNENYPFLGGNFWFLEDKTIKFLHIKFIPSKNTTQIIFTKSDKDISVERKKA